MVMWSHSLCPIMWVIIYKLIIKNKISYPPFPGKTDERIMEKVAKG